VKIHRYKFRSVVATCFLGCDVCSECRAVCTNGTQNTHQNLKHMLPQQCITYINVKFTD